MPLIEETELAKLLKGSVDKNIWLIFGKDDFLKEYYCKKLVDKCVDESLRFFNFHIYNDDDKKLDVIFSDADNLPVMSEKTCLLVRNYPLTEMGDAQFEEFKSSLSNIPETTVAVFYYNTIELIKDTKIESKWQKFVNLFSSLGYAVNLSHRDPQKTAKMLVSKAPSRGTVISEADARYLIETVGDDMQTLLQEFNKICSFSRGEPITRKMIDTLAVKSVDANVFDISMSILSGNTDKAYSITNELLKTKTPVQPVIGAMASTFVNMYRYKTAVSTGHGKNDFKTAFGYNDRSDYAFRAVIANADKISLNGIREAIDILLEYDVITKSRSFEPNNLMPELIARLSAVCRKR